MNIPSDRRNFLKRGGQAFGGLLMLGAVSKSLAATCKNTPAQTPGPFYPGANQFHTDTDLTQLPGHSAKAEGQVVYIKGKVIDGDCKPIANANVEIWQACASGKYNNPNDPNPATLDPHFKYWAETYTNAKGEYIFKTIIPGAYPADTDWTRPPHIHFKISRLGYKDLVTQMYFKGEKWNDTDLILQNIPATERDSVIVDFQPAPDLGPGSMAGSFDITLKGVR